MSAVNIELNARRETVGEFLLKLRQDSGLTQRDVASKLRYNSPQFVSNWERGVSLPPVSVLPTLAKIYRADAIDIVNVLSSYYARVSDIQRAQLMKVFKLSSRST